MSALPWPAMSPDSSSIERVRGILGKRVRKRISQPSTLGELGGEKAGFVQVE